MPLLRRLGPTASGVAIVFAATFALAACDSNDDPGTTPPLVQARLRTLQADNPTIEADGATTTQLRATIAPDDDSLQRRLVTFSTSLGTLVGVSPAAAASPSTINTNASGSATIQLRAPRTTGTALVSASAGGVVLTTTVFFVAALPDSIALDASAVKVKAGFDSSVTVRAQLRRRVGLVTPGATVAFSAVKANGGPTGRFGIATAADDNGLATVRFFPADSLYVGPIVITATAAASAGRSVQATTTVNTVP